MVEVVLVCAAVNQRMAHYDVHIITFQFCNNECLNNVCKSRHMWRKINCFLMLNIFSECLGAKDGRVITQIHFWGFDGMRHGLLQNIPYLTISKIRYPSWSQVLKIM